MACSICVHPDRQSIEEHVMAFNYGIDGLATVEGEDPSSNFTLESIAEKFNVDLKDLQIHAVMHTTKVAQLEGQVSSISDDLKMYEAVVLNDSIKEFQTTMRIAGQKIRKQFAGADGRGLSKEVVDVYINSGNQIRGAVKELFDMNQRINGEDKDGVQALATVVAAIRGSEPPQPTMQYSTFSGPVEPDAQFQSDFLEG